MLSTSTKKCLEPRTEANRRVEFANQITCDGCGDCNRSPENDSIAMNHCSTYSYYFAWSLSFTIAVAALPSCSRRNTTEMEAALDSTITGETTDDVMRSTKAIAGSLSRTDKKRFADVRFEYIVAYGDDGMAERLRGKTVRQVLDEFKPTGVDPLKTGVTDGVEWKLYAKPDSPPARNEPPSKVQP